MFREEWDSIVINKISTLIDSISSRVAGLVTTREGHIEY